MSRAEQILFLGYSDKKTRLHSILEGRGCVVEHSTEKLVDTSEFDLIISFGYRHIIPNEIIVASCPIVNLHLSYLPFNRGSHPNFWSHFDDTPSGVTIHLIDEGIDTGPCLFQKRVFFDTSNQTFKESYQILINEIENLFILNIDEILSLEFEPKKYEEKWLSLYFRKGTYHNYSDLPKEVDWSSIIDDQIQILSKDK